VKPEEWRQDFRLAGFPAELFNKFDAERRQTNKIKINKLLLLLTQPHDD